MLAVFWGCSWLFHGICTQWYSTAKKTFLTYVDANPVIQDIVCKWPLRPTVYLSLLELQQLNWSHQTIYSRVLHLENTSEANASSCSSICLKYPHGCPTCGTVWQGLIWGQVLGIASFPAHLLSSCTFDTICFVQLGDRQGSLRSGLCLIGWGCYEGGDKCVAKLYNIMQCLKLFVSGRWTLYCSASELRWHTWSL